MEFINLEEAKEACQIISGNIGIEWNYTVLENGNYYVEWPASDNGRRGLEKFIENKSE